jgi:hypothetical protein
MIEEYAFERGLIMRFATDRREDKFVIAAHLRHGLARQYLRRIYALLWLALALVSGVTAPLSAARAAAKLPELDAALAAQVSDQARKDWNPDAVLVQISVTATGDGAADGTLSSTPVSFIFRAGSKAYQMTMSRYGEFLGAQAPVPRDAQEAIPVTFISLKNALTLARAKGFTQAGNLHPVLQSFISTDGLRKIGWLFAAPGDPIEKQIFVTADGHQAGSVKRILGTLRQ